MLGYRRPVRAPFVVLLLLSAPAFGHVAKPAKLLNAAELAGPDAYPEASRRAEEVGIVGVRATVGLDGRAADCQVELTSGYAQLDAGTCALFVARGRFEPARDARGRAVSAEVRQAFRWSLEASPDGDPTADAMRRVEASRAMSRNGVAIVRAELAAWGAGLMSPRKGWLREVDEYGERYWRALAAERPGSATAVSAGERLVAANVELASAHNRLFETMIDRLGPADAAALAQVALAWAREDEARGARPAQEAAFVAANEAAIRSAAVSAAGGEAVRAGWTFAAHAAEQAALDAAWRGVWAAVAQSPVDRAARSAALDAHLNVVRASKAAGVARSAALALRLSDDDRRRLFTLTDGEPLDPIPRDQWRKAAELLAAPGLSPTGRAMLRAGLRESGELDLLQDRGEYGRLTGQANAAIAAPVIDVERLARLLSAAEVAARDSMTKRLRMLGALLARVSAADRAAYASHRRAQIEKEMADYDASTNLAVAQRMTRDMRLSASGREVAVPLMASAWPRAARHLELARDLYDGYARGDAAAVRAAEAALIEAQIASAAEDSVISTAVAAKLSAADRALYIQALLAVNAPASAQAAQAAGAP